MGTMDTLLPLLLIFGAILAYVKRCEEPFSQLGLCEKDKKEGGEAAAEGGTEGGEAAAADCEGMKGKEKKKCEEGKAGAAAEETPPEDKKKGGKKKKGKSNYANAYFSDARFQRSYHGYGRVSYG